MEINQFQPTNLKTFVLSHLVWVVIIVILAFAVHAWLVQHDARLQAEQQEKISEHVIEDLKSQMAEREAQRQKDVQIVTRIVHDSKTPTQVVAAIPQLTDAPLNTRVIPGSPADVAVAAQPLVELLGQCKTDAINLNACQKDLADQTKITAQLETEKASWKKAAGHHSFFGKVWGGAQKVGLLGIGIALGRVI